MAHWASRTVSTYRQLFRREHSSKGFTIVELLIVVVVVAILAAITIVAYNGIQNRAKASAAQAAVSQALTKIQAYAVQNADAYPADLATAGLSDGSSTSYQYRVDNSANPKTFCLTATTSNVSYYVSNTSNSPTAGACAGHGVNGVAAVTNLFPNPGASGSTVGYGYWSGNSGNTGSQSIVSASWTQSGSAYRATWSAVASPDTGDIQVNLSNAPALSSNTTYTAVFKLRGPNRSSYVSAETLYSPSGSINTIAKANSTGQSLSPNQVVTRWLTFSGDATAFSTGFRIIQTLTSKIPGDYVELGDVLVYPGGYDPSLNWGWGNSPGWVWNGTPNSSTSTGPPL